MSSPRPAKRQKNDVALAVQQAEHAIQKEEAEEVALHEERLAAIRRTREQITTVHAVRPRDEARRSPQKYETCSGWPQGVSCPRCGLLTSGSAFHREWVRPPSISEDAAADAVDEAASCWDSELCLEDIDVDVHAKRQRVRQ